MDKCKVNALCRYSFLIVLIVALGTNMYWYFRCNQMENAYKVLLDSKYGASVLISANEVNILDRIDTSISILSVIATVLGIVFVVITLSQTHNFNQLERNVENKIEEIDKKWSRLENDSSKLLMEFKKEYPWLNCLPYILLGNYNQLIKENVYANAAYETAYSIDNKNIIVNYFIGMHYAEIYHETKNDSIYSPKVKYLDKAEKYILNAVNLCHHENAEDVLKLELNIVLGSIYGLYGEKYKKDDHDGVLEKTATGYFEKSIYYLRKAIEIDKNQRTAYTNLGITYLHLGQVDEAINSFCRAIEEDRKSVLPKYSKKNLPWLSINLKKVTNQNLLKKFDLLKDMLE